MIGKVDVEDYEDIIDYFETDSDLDELEIVSRLSMEDDWDTATPELKQRILAVDNLVLERYADWFEYDLFKRYIATIKRRLQLEEDKNQR
ncbi:MAG TPA: hypothetical protein GX398_02185 [Candidatus Cloacimonetes bacterium]|nr:hypothetical protein [Candidatus Cloacimonadota bacterium]